MAEPPTVSSCAVYWERQGVNRLCAVHCVNTILQGPVFGDDDFWKFAHELDEQELSLLEQNSAGETTNSASPQTIGTSHNSDETGNFSLGVIERALAAAGGFEAVYVDRKDVNRDPRCESGFVANSHEQRHWFAVRRVWGRWWDLNSLRQGPLEISESELGDVLERARDQGFTVFAVRSQLGQLQADRVDLPNPDPLPHGDLMQLSPHQHFLSDEGVHSLGGFVKRFGVADNAASPDDISLSLQKSPNGGFQRRVTCQMVRQVLCLFLLLSVLVGGVVVVIYLLVAGGGRVR